ncbi:hypothetical protein [Lysinibacillus cavernae]|uniref:hypothetical protein n=1 Tax=Lysinibacillus cavernae TaxID=2666135 RepID=UPI001E49DD6C|nr:hypothetical protein [Lysinibacillus cavernae]
MSNMNKNRKNAKAKETISASTTNQKLHQEEFGSEFELDAASAQVNNLAETQGKSGIKQPVSERTAWH